MIKYRRITTLLNCILAFLLIAIGFLLYGKRDQPIWNFDNKSIELLKNQRWSFEREGTYYFSFSNEYKLPIYNYKIKSNFLQKKLFTPLGITINKFFSMGKLYDNINDNNINEDIIPKNKIVHYNLNDLKFNSQALKNNENILILTNMETFNSEYWDNLLELTYPRNLIEIGIIVPLTDQTNTILQQLNIIIKKIQTESTDSNGQLNNFKKITILKDDDTERSKFNKDTDPTNCEIERRRKIATRKNQLLFSTLGPNIGWVLWLDSTIIKTPVSLIQDLTNHGKAIITTNILIKNNNNNNNNNDNSNNKDSLNNWVGSKKWEQIKQGIDTDSIIIEGVSDINTDRPLMNQFYDQNASPLTEMELDSVSTDCTLVKSEVHRDGAMFPNFPFYNLIETEGFTKMAKRLNYQAYGLPNYVVYRE